MRPERRSAGIAGLVLTACLLSGNAEAVELRLGIFVGNGSGSITTSGANLIESPIALKLVAETPLFEKGILSLEHWRTLQLSPMDSGISFTSVAFQFYPWGILWVHPDSTSSSDGKVTESGWTQKRISPFIGAGLGYGTASLNQTVSGIAVQASGSAMSMTLRLGLDYTVFNAAVLRGSFELNDGLSGASISGSALMLGLVFPL